MTQENQTLADRALVLQEIQPGLLGLMDGSVSTLAPIFAPACAASRWPSHARVRDVHCRGRDAPSTQSRDKGRNIPQAIARRATHFMCGRVLTQCRQSSRETPPSRTLAGHAKAVKNKLKESEDP